jgi:hypothetical protein
LLSWFLIVFVSFSLVSVKIEEATDD